jgi:hypothetical protein
MTALNLGICLLRVGALVAGLCVARMICVRHVPMDTVPSAIRLRIERGNQLTPFVLAAAVVAICAGSAMWLLART